MKFLDVLEASGRALGGHPKRTGLCLLGMSIGVAAVVVLCALGEGARQYLRGQFEFLGTDVIEVLPGKVETSGGLPGFGGVPNDLTIADARAIQRSALRANRVAPISIGNEAISHGDLSRQAIVVGSTAEYFQIRKLELRAGEFLAKGPWDRSSREVVLGQEVASELFPGRTPVGETVHIGAWRMRVIGVIASQGVRFGMNLDQTVFVPVATALSMFDKSSLFRVTIQVKPGADIDKLQASCERLLEERHGEEDFTIATPDAILESLDSILNALALGLVGIAAISMAVAGIGIMNVMLVSVAERRSEIGLEKAIGAEPRQILYLFLAEASMLSTLGATLGIALAYVALAGAEMLYPSFPFQAPAWAIAGSIVLSVVLGTTFGLLPATRAVRLDPLEALNGGAQ